MTFKDWARIKRLRRNAHNYSVAESAWAAGFHEGASAAFIDIWRQQAKAREKELGVKADMDQRAMERLVK